PYRLDSIAFYYMYQKYNDSALKDQLVVQFYDQSKVKYYVWQTTPVEPWVTAEYDKNTLSGTDYTKEIVKELDYNDTATLEGGTYRWMSFAVNMDIAKANNPVCAVTFTFKPAYSYNIGDTLYADPSQQQPYKKLNSFWHRMYHDGDGTPVYSYNNGMLMNYEVRYGLLTGNMAQLNYKYLPGSAFSATFYPYMIFKITYDADWVESISEGDVSFKVGEVYPNPSVGASKLTVKLENPAVVSVDIVNPLGQTIRAIDEQNFKVGEHHMDLITADLASGVYFVKVNVGEFSSTQRLLVQ
ncbi:T9SS type A sorting domain-containing protein, partial [Bacteroidota bacterium]